MGPPLRKGVILLLGLVWCRSKCRRVIVRSLAASPNAEIGICACCSYKVPAPFCFDRRGGPSIALDRGLRLRRGGRIATFLPPRSRTSGDGLLLPASWKGGATRRALNRARHRRA